MPATPAAAQNLSFGPVMERVIQARETGTNLFLNLDTGELLTPPAGITGTLGENERNWQALDIPKDSRSFRYIQWLRESGADLMFAGDGKVIGFDGAFPFAHGNDSTNWESWDDLTPAQVQNAVAVIEWGRKVDEAKLRNQPWPPAPQPGGVINSAMQIDSRSPGGPLVNLLTLKQSAMWFFKTREGGMGILQITGFTENPPGVKIRYKLVQQSTNSPASPVSALTWGEPVENLAVSLQADKTVWRSNETPILHASLRNNGEMILNSSRDGSQLQQVEVDGKWYRSRVTYYEIQGTNGQEAVVSMSTPLYEIQPGEQWDNVQISMRQGDWQRATTNDLTLATYPFRNWVEDDTGIAPVMLLLPGKHTVRVAFVVDPARRIYGKSAFRVISNPVELEIR
jgi:hypothetical protein